MATVTITIETENNISDDMLQDVVDHFGILTRRPRATPLIENYISTWAIAVEGPDGVSFKPKDHPGLKVNIST